jgi:LysM repeat protein
MTRSVSEERIIPFPASARSIGDQDAQPRRRRDIYDHDRPTPTRRTPRRRRQTTPWLQRNALSVAAVSILIAILGLGFGLLQLMTRPDMSSTQVATQADPSAGTTQIAASIGPSVQLGTLVGPAGDARNVVAAPREIVSTAKVIDPNYTVAPGDTLGKIAVQFGTTVERIQALNNLSDPRALRVGTRLVIPPAF